MAALVAPRHNSVLKEFYRHLLRKGKAKKLALAAVARNLLVTLNAILRDKTPGPRPNRPKSAPYTSKRCKPRKQLFFLGSSN